MTVTILQKRSSTPSSVPTTAQLNLGQWGINTYDGKAYLKKNVSGVDSIVHFSDDSKQVLKTDATSTNTGSAVVQRDGSGNFSAGTITATLNGNASSANTVPAITATATVANSTFYPVLHPSTSGNGTAQASTNFAVNASTGVLTLGGKVLTLGGSLTTSGAFASTFTMTGVTAVTFPTTGTLATLAGAETLTNKTLTSPVITAGTVGVAATLTAGTNAQGQGAMTADYNVVTTNASNPGGVTLPTVTVAGRRVTVDNATSNPVNVYPVSLSFIDGGAENVPVRVPAGKRVEFTATTTTAWRSSLRDALSDTPAFRAKRTTNQTGLLSGIPTKVILPTEDFDTASCFDNVTNNRFQPNVEGYYQLNASLYISGVNITLAIAIIRKNGVDQASSFYTVPATGDHRLSLGDLLYFNGSTDYAELWGQFNGTSGSFMSTSCFSGYLARPA